jgi:hypothetical protein
MKSDTVSCYFLEPEDFELELGELPPFTADWTTSSNVSAMLERIPMTFSFVRLRTLVVDGGTALKHSVRQHNFYVNLGIAVHVSPCNVLRALAGKAQISCFRRGREKSLTDLRMQRSLLQVLQRLSLIDPAKVLKVAILAFRDRASSPRSPLFFAILGHSHLLSRLLRPPCLGGLFSY